MAHRDLSRDEEVNGVRIHRVPCIRSSTDISYPHELASYMASAIPTALRMGKSRSYDLLHCHFIVPDGVAALWPSRRFDIPLVVTAHGSDVPGYNPDRFKALHKLISPAWRGAVMSIDRIVCPSRFLERLLHEHAPKARTIAIPNGFDPARLDPTKERKKSILMVSRILERKGLQDALRALADTDLGFNINIVGTGPYLSTLVKLADELDVDVKFHGWLDNNSTELKELFETSEIFVFPSHAENCPIVLLEAMAAGLAIVTANDSGCIEVVGDTALCVPRGDQDAIRDALEKLAGDDGLRSSLGVAARKRLEARFGWPSVAKRYTEVFHDLTSAGS